MQWKRTVAACCLAGSAVVSVAACSSWGGSHPANPAGPPTNGTTVGSTPTGSLSTTGTEPAGNPPGGKAMPTAHACTLVPVATVESATGQKVEASDLDTNGDNLCSWTYTSSAGKFSVDLTVVAAAAGASELALLRANGKTVPDLGVEAYSMEDPSMDGSDGEPGASLLANEGTWYLRVAETSDQAKVAHLIPIAKAALAN